jgi:hypothetical protein
MSCVGGASQPRDDAADRPGGVGVAERLQLPPALPAVGSTLPPAADQVGDGRRPYPGGGSPLQPSRAGRRVSTPVGLHGWPTDTPLPGHEGDGCPRRPERPPGVIDGAPAGVPGRPCGTLPRLHGRGALASAPVHGRDGHGTRERRARHRRADRRRPERRPVVDQEGLQGLAEVLHQRQPLDHVYGVGCPPA